ncbi:helix-turn-helix transcriptional regulator [Parabacteroides goldsteinii]|uniref:helix-turn-helix transcriptional regulator n=1 Tax=Parabacteroides goldsteinii TaxID=328812 RepID=UPI0032B2E180
MKQSFTFDSQYFGQLSTIAPESFYVLDVLQRKICYVKSDDLFLCGFSTEDVLRLGYDFYPKIIYSDDLPLWMDMREHILQYLKVFEEDWNEIDYFSCTFRLQRTYSFSARPLSQMVYHRMIPVWTDNELCYLICCVESSTIGEVGNLCLHYKDGLRYNEYKFLTKRWKQKIKESLTERERAILMLAEQGRSSTEIGNILCKGHNTIRNQIKALFSKLKVHSMQGAIEFARNFRMIYPIRDIRAKNIDTP